MVGWAGKGPGEDELTVALVATATDPQGRVFALHPVTCPARTGIFHVYTVGPVIPPAFAAGRRSGGEGSLAGHPHPGSCPQEPQCRTSASLFLPLRGNGCARAMSGPFSLLAPGGRLRLT